MASLSVINKVEMEKRTMLRDSQVQELNQRLESRRKVRDDEAAAVNKRIVNLEAELKKEKEAKAKVDGDN